MRSGWRLQATIVPVVVLVGAALLAGAATGSELDRARAEFEKHNYRRALEIAEGSLKTSPGDVEAKLLRGRCLLKLRQWAEGVAELEELLASNEELAQRVELHEELGAVGLEQHEYRVLAITHFGAAAELYVAQGNNEAAAWALIKQADGFVQFDKWKELPGFDGEPPTDWRESRRLQRKYAVEALERAIALAGNTEPAIEATFRMGRLYHRDLRTDADDIDTASDVFAELAERWPKSARAPEALYLMGQIAEQFKQDYVAAVTHYQRVVNDYGSSSWAQRCTRRIENITAPVVQLRTEGPVLPGETGLIHYNCRNVPELTLRAYRVDLFTIVRGIGPLHELDKWQPKGEPVATWKVTLPDRGEHQFFDSNAEGLRPASLPVADPGAYLVVASGGEGQARATVLTLVSRLSCLTKGARSATLLLTADAVTGQPAADAEVLVQRHVENDRFDYASGKTDDAGRYRLVTPDWAKDGGRSATAFVRDGEHYAICGSTSHWYWWGYGRPYRAYCFTERPVYRPDQIVHFKTVLRHYDQGSYDNVAGKAVSMEVYDPRGQVVEQRELRTNDQGSASGELRLPDDAPLGMYTIRLKVDGQPIDAGRGARFRIEEYRKPEFEVTVAAEKPDYRIGEPIEVRIEARYYFGEPVAGAKVACTVHRSRHYPHFCFPTPWPWLFDDFGPGYRGGPYDKMIRPPGDYRRRDLVGTFELTTDDQGMALLRLDNQPLESDPEADLCYDIEAEVTDTSRRVISGAGRIKVTHDPFYVNVRPQRNVYQPGDTVRLEINAKGPNDDPVAFKGVCKVYRLWRSLSEDKGQPKEEYQLGDKVFERPVEVGADGAGQVEWITDQEGPFRVVVVAPAGPDDEVIGKCDLWIAKRGGRYQHYAYRDVELVLDQPSYRVGDTANVLINTRFDSCYVLLTAEGDDLYDDRIIFVKGGTHLVDLPITKQHVPNFELSAAVLRDNKVYQDQVPVVVPPVDRFLTVKLDTPGETFHPREQIDVGVTTTDSSGAPAPAEVALMMVDASIYYVQPELREQIEKYFYGQKRPHLVQTQTSFDLYGRSRGNRHPVASAIGGDVMAPKAAVMKEAGLKAMPLVGEAPVEAFAEAEIRKDFPDTVLWAAHVTTDDAGRATLPVTLPDTLTTWRIWAIAVDRDTRVGQTSADVVTRKDIIARLEAPRFLVEGDEPLITVIAHNYLPEEKRVKVTLSSSDAVEILPAVTHQAEGADAPAGEALVTVPPGGEVAVDFPARALAAGSARLTATVAADVDADAIEITLPVVTYGADRFIAHSGSLRQDAGRDNAVISLTVPQEIAPDSPRMEIHLNPSIAAVMIDALPYLLDYPYGCTEQTVSRFLPAVVTRRTLHRLGIDLADIQDKINAQGGPANARLPERFRRNPVFNNAVMDDMIRKGLDRLADLQRPDGGWGWWGGGASNPYMTAYVVYGLTEAVAADVAVDQAMLQRGVDFLLKRVASPEAAARHMWGDDDDNVRAWMLYALAMHDAESLKRDEVRAVLDRIYEDRDGLTDYSRALLMIALHQSGDSERVNILVENFYNTVRIDEQTGTVSWGHNHRYRYWYDNGLETTAMVLRGLLMTQPEHEYIPQAVNWLVRNRRGARWFSTKDTAFAVYALADYLVASGELQADLTVSVNIDGRIERSFRITPENALTFDAQIVVSSADLAPGEHTVALTRSGKGNLYYGVYLDYFTRQDPIEPAGSEVYVARSYHRLVPKEVTRTRSVYDPQQRKAIQETYQAIDYDREPLGEGEPIASGELIEVQLDIDARNNFEYLIFEDPKPAGCEPTELHSGYQYGSGPCVNVELRDQKTVFFATYLSQGKHELTYRLRCETPGRFHALPTKVEAMYSPLVRANSRSDKLRITD